MIGSASVCWYPLRQFRVHAALLEGKLNHTPWQGFPDSLTSSPLVVVVAISAARHSCHDDDDNINNKTKVVVGGRRVSPSGMYQASRRCFSGAGCLPQTKWTLVKRWILWQQRREALFYQELLSVCGWRRLPGGPNQGFLLWLWLESDCCYRVGMEPRPNHLAQESQPPLGWFRIRLQHSNASQVK